MEHKLSRLSNFLFCQESRNVYFEMNKSSDNINMIYDVNLCEVVERIILEKFERSVASNNLVAKFVW